MLKNKLGPNSGGLIMSQMCVCFSSRKNSM